MQKEHQHYINILMANGVVTADDVQHLRGQVFTDGVVARDEADLLFQLNDRLVNGRADPSWADFFVDALKVYFLRQSSPEGYISDESTDYLISKVSRDGQVHSMTELELVVEIIEKAVACPARLKDFIYGQVMEAVLHNSGPLRHGGMLQPNVLSAAEVDLIERTMYGTGGDRSIAISQREAKFLFDLNDATVASSNHSSWRELFVKGIGNYLMAALPYEAPSAEEKLRQEDWLEERGTTMGFMGKMAESLKGGPKALLDALFGANDRDALWEERNADYQARIDIAEQITDSEANWLIERINRDGGVHPNEQALLAFLRERAPYMPPQLDALMDKVA